MMDAAQRRRLSWEFMQRFGDEPEVWASAPGRVDLMGSHTDYNQGLVLTLPIAQETWMLARPRRDARVVIQSLNVPGSSAFELARIIREAENPWANYVRGVAWVLLQAGYPLIGFDGLIYSTIPLQSGLSSSAALEVATARLFSKLGNWEIDPVQLARLCQQAENEFVGMNCGILDQYTCSVGTPGNALLLDCRSLAHTDIPVRQDVQIAVCDTRSKRALTGSEYPERRAQCERGAALLAAQLPGVTALRDVNLEQFEACVPSLPPVVEKRCRFILQENGRVPALVQALQSGDEPAIGQHTQASFVGARDLFEIVSPEMEQMMGAMLSAPGVIGARQAGAGFGGCMVAFVRQEQVAAFSQHVCRAYTAVSGIQPGVYPVEWYKIEPTP